MELKFTKMHGLGNDFVVFDFTEHVIALSETQASHIADRHFGVGCDQILIVERSTRDDIDFKYRILNADGSEVGQCGNGARCFVRYVHEKGLSDKNPITVETSTGQMVLFEDEATNLVTVDMGAPRFEPMDIPLKAARRQPKYHLEHGDERITFSALSMGNPHAVLIVDDIGSAPVLELGASLECHSLFPERANIGFMKINDRADISLRVFERGAGETIACGSGTCAAVVAGIQDGLLDNKVIAHLTAGDLTIEWQGEGHSVMMTGAAETSFEGVLKL
ncbi:MAG: diaminopimelate epimerase [Arenicella sp.]|nr:diaminopimelate epimerase [Arenicella sp.]